MKTAIMDIWCNFKKALNEKNRAHLYLNEREVWWFSLGYNVGYELNGKKSDFSRPCVILRKINRDMAFVVPLTSVDKSSSVHHFYVGEVSGRQAFAVLSQARTVDIKRVQNKIGMISESNFNNLKESMSKYLRL